MSLSFRLAFLFLVGCLIADPLRAVEALSKADSSPVEESPVESPATEEWYWQIHLGSGATSYTGKIKDIKSTLDESTMHHRSTTQIDVGFYWPVAPALTLGFAFGGIVESYGYKDQSDTVSIVQSNLSASGIYSLGEELFIGPMVRADLGSASLGFVVEGSEHPELPRQNRESGYSALFGLGWGFPVAEDTRFSIWGNLLYTGTDGSSALATSVAVGMNF